MHVGSHLIPRVTRRRTLAAVLAFTLLAAVTVGTPTRTEAMTKSTEHAWVGMPFSGHFGNADWGSYPGQHGAYGADWATDLYAEPGTAVQALVGAGSGAVSLVGRARAACGSTGTAIIVDVFVDGVSAGWVYYGHLADAALAIGESRPIAYGEVLGTTALWTYQPGCWEVRTRAGVHTHVGVYTTGAWSCWAGHASHQYLDAGMGIGVVGGTGSAARACSGTETGDTQNDTNDDHDQGGQTGLTGSAARGDIVGWRNADGSVTSWFVTMDGHRRWISDASTYWCLREHGSVDHGPQPAGVLDAMPDDNGRWAWCPTDRLGHDMVLKRGGHIRSQDGRYSLELQASDGNLVLYGPSGRAIWAMHRPSAQFLVMQPDANLVQYGASGPATWASNTWGSGAGYFVVQNDGNMVLYRNDGRPVWASGTAGRT